MAALGNKTVTLQATVEALGNQINNGNHGNSNGKKGPMTLSSFLKVHPSSFRGISNPSNADNWIQAMEQALQAQQVSEEQCVEFETYQLQGEAQKYFPSLVRNAKELELLQLKQGQMTIAEYTNKFEELCRFSRICQEMLEGFDKWKCIKYEGGFRGDIPIFVVPMEIRVFSELWNKSQIVEECVRNVVMAKNDNREFHRRDHHQNLIPRSQEFKRTGNYLPDRQHKNKQGRHYWCGSPGHLVKDSPSPRGGNS
ncbi:uncharacterized protein LOC130966574 [Arachis stenosperma]|uniref:uncharacterized protein LOC130966574 n=1 Tax=Arachis stenosperma TaxID=217475 RepID=UPI0025AC8992|nr:uncharacterized protein LOC130966574 [Arachis stenosperma]